MKLRVVHRTHSAYAEPAKESFNEARLQPLTAEGQDCDAFILKTRPSGRLSHYLHVDLHRVHCFEVVEPHSALSIESVSSVSTSEGLVAEDARTVPFSCLHEGLKLERCYDFLQPSRYVSVRPEVCRLA